MESELGQQKLYVCVDKRTVPYATCEDGANYVEEEVPFPPS